MHQRPVRAHDFEKNKIGVFVEISRDPRCSFVVSLYSLIVPRFRVVSTVAAVLLLLVSTGVGIWIYKVRYYIYLYCTPHD